MNDSAKKIEEAQELLNSGQLQQAWSAYISIAESSPDNAEAWLMCGLLGAECGSTDEAIESLNKALVINPMYPEAHLALANIHNVLNNQDKARDLLLKAVEIDDEYAEAWAMLGGIYGALGEYDESKKCSSRAVELWPECVEALGNLGNVYDFTGDHEQAATCFQKMLQIAPGSADFHYRLSQQYKTLGKVNEEEQHLRDALKLDPKNEPAQFQLARLLHNKNDWMGATAGYRETVRLQPDNANAWYFLGLLLEREGNRSEAETCYQKVIAISEETSHIKLKAHAKLQIAGIYINQDKSIEAAELLKDVVRVIPENSAAVHLLSVVGAAPVPERCSDDFVTKLFDGFADDFDTILVDKLGYRTPELIYDSVKNVFKLDGSVDLSILDLGCGTGLCGTLLQPLSNNLIGIDLSPKMIDVARQKNVYNSLLTGDILEVMHELETKCDVVISADVFIYIGALDELFIECERVLNSKGIFVFSIELCSDEVKYKLLSTGRYAHNPAYIRDMAQRQGFEELGAIESPIRIDSGVPIPGMIFTLRK